MIGSFNNLVAHFKSSTAGADAAEIVRALRATTKIASKGIPSRRLVFFVSGVLLLVLVRLLLFSELDRPSRSLRFRHLCVPLPKDMTKDRADQHDQVETHEPCVQATQIECLVLTRGGRWSGRRRGRNAHAQGVLSLRPDRAIPAAPPLAAPAAAVQPPGTPL